MHALFPYRRVLDERDKIYSQLAEYLQLKNVIEHIKVSFHSHCFNWNDLRNIYKHT